MAYGVARAPRGRARVLRRHPRRPADRARAARGPRRRATAASAIEELNPLNAITEADARRARARARRARLHRHEALAPADRRGGRGRARRRRRRRRRPRARAALLAPVDRAATASSSRTALAGRAELAHRRELARPSRFVDVLADRVRGTRRHVVFTAHSLPRASSPRATRIRSSCSRRPARRRARGARRLVVLLPERVADRRAVARARTSSTTSTTSHARGVARRARLPGRLRLRPPRDPLGHRRRGAGAGARARDRASSGSRCRTPTRTSSRGSPRSSRQRARGTRRAAVRSGAIASSASRGASASTRASARTLKELVVLARPRPRPTDVWALRDVSFAVEPGEARRARRPERLGQDHAAAHRRRDHQADRRARRGRRADRLAARARRRLPPRLHRARERLPQRLDPRALARVDPRALGRDRRVRRARGVHRPARAHLLVGDVHAARLRGRGAPGRGRAAARRGVRRRRRGVPAQVLRRRSSSSSSAAARSCSSRTTRPRSSGCATARSCCATGSVAFDGPTRDAIARYHRLLAEERDPGRARRRACASGAAARRGSPRCGCSAPTVRSATQFLAGEPLVAAAAASSPERRSPPPRLSLELRDEDGLLARRPAASTASSAGTAAPATSRCASRSTRCRSPTAASTFALGARRRRRAGTSATGSTTRRRFVVYPGGDERGLVRLEGRWSARNPARRRTEARMSSRTCPDWPRPDGDRAGAAVQALHGRRGEAARPRRSCTSRTSSLDDVAICCDLERHVFYAEHTDPGVAEALRGDALVRARRVGPTGPGGATTS